MYCHCPQHELDSVELVDHEINNHLFAIVALKRRRNALIPIFRLPSELLSSIFLYLITDVDPSLPYDSTGGWLDVLSVCKQWRDVGVYDPRLWGFWGTFASPRCLPIFASRSKAAPLSIRVFQPTQEFVDAWETAFQDPSTWPRVRELNITCGTRSKTAQLLSAFKQASTAESTSHIESLCINTNLPENEHNLALPALLTTGQFPRLFWIIVSKCDVDWTSSIFDTSILAHLSISGTSPSNRATVTRLMEILSKQPMLKSFVLEPGPLHTAMERTVRLKRRLLRAIRLSGSAESCMGLISNISYSKKRSTRISLHLNSNMDTTEFDDHVIPFLSRHYGKRLSPSTSIHCIGVENIDDSTLKLSLWHDKDPDLSSSIPLPPCSIDITMSSARSEEHPDIMKASLAALPLTYLRKLSVGNIHMTMSEWHQMFSSLWNLEELELCGDESLGAIIALNPEGGFGSYNNPDSAASTLECPRIIDAVQANGERATIIIVEAPSPLALPKLTRLHCKDFDFYMLGPGGEECSDLLVECVAARHDKHHRIDCVQVNSCDNVTDDLLEGLSPYVDKVDWDGYGVPVSDEEDEDEEG